MSGIYNIASGKSINILDLANFMIQESGKDLDINFEKSRIGEIQFSKVSVQKAKNNLKFIPNFNIFDELKKLINA